MQYLIEVDDEMKDILERNAKSYGKSVPEIISELLRRYVVDAHIMEQDELWQSGINECASINLDWANL